MNHVSAVNNNYIKPATIAGTNALLKPLKNVYSFIQNSRVKSANYKVAEQLHRIEYREHSFSAVLTAVTNRDLDSLK